MLKFLKAFGPMMLTIVGVVTVLGSFFFWENVNIFNFMLTFGIWFLFIPKLALSEDKCLNIAYLIRNKEYATAMFVTFFKIIVVIFWPLLALLFVCNSTIIVWGALISVSFAALALCVFLMIVIASIIRSMYKEAIKRYRS